MKFYKATQFIANKAKKRSIALILLPYLILSLLIVPVLASQSSSIEISSSGIVSYQTVRIEGDNPESTSSLSSTTSPTPTPTIYPTSNNLAPMFQVGMGKYDGCTWGDYHITGQVHYGLPKNPQICFRDDTVTHNGHSSIRLEQQNEYNKWREVDNLYMSVRPGDKIVFKCWIKTNSLTSGSGLGAIIGFDFGGNGIRFAEAHPANPQSAIWNTHPQVTKPIYVPYGSDWTLLTLDVVIPNTAYTRDWDGALISPTQIDYIIPWVGASWNSQTNYPTVWFADAELYIN